MPDKIRFWDGQEWQRHVNKLLKLRYSEPGSYQEMPSRDKGDLGIEGFSRDGICYQCYAAEEPATVDVLHDKQRDKITSDIKKFLANSKRLSAVFGGLKIRRWLLVVPRFHSTRLLAHAETKAQDVRAAHLPYIDTEFTIGIIIEDEFLVELQRLAKTGLYSHHFDVPDPADALIQEFSAVNSALFSAAISKSAKLPKLSTDSPRRRFAEHMVKCFLRGQAAIDGLRARDPEQFEQFLRLKKSKESALTVQSMVEVGDSALLSATVREFKKELQEELAISSHTADLLAWESVSDWIFRCPLDF